MSTLNVTTIQNLSTLTASGQVSVGGNLLMNSGYGSAATAYGCRAWVNFNGNTVTIRNSGNISSLTRNAQGYFTLNLINSMPDANGCVVTSMHNTDNGGGGDTYPEFNNNNVLHWGWTYTSSGIRMKTAWVNNTNYNGFHIYAALFR